MSQYGSLGSISLLSFWIMLATSLILLIPLFGTGSISLNVIRWEYHGEQVSL